MSSLYLLLVAIHCANWTFIAWGLLNFYIIPLLLTNNNRNYLETIARGQILPNLKEFLLIIFTFGLTVFAWIFFRAESISHAFRYISRIFSTSIMTIPEFTGELTALILIFIIGLFLLIEWMGRENHFAIEKFGLKWSITRRWGFYFLIICSLFIFNENNNLLFSILKK